MASTEPRDAVIVGASLAGCTAAILLARAGARVTLVEKQPDPGAFKRVCSHFVQASGVPTIERLGLLEPFLEAGAVRPAIHSWTRWGWIAADPARAPRGLNLRRRVMDPIAREAAAAAGVKLLLGYRAERLLRDGDSVVGVVVSDREGGERELRAALTVGADGRDSAVAAMAGVREKTHPHARFAYGGYFQGEPPRYSPDASVWFLDPHWGAAFPTDSGLTFYAAMPTKKLLPEFKRDPEAALVEFIGGMPDPPPIKRGRLVEPVIGKVEMPNRVRGPVAPGLALIGDAALATDPLFGVGCGWAFQSAEWLADSVAPALRGEEALEPGLGRYRRRHRRGLGGHAFLIHDYANGRRLNPAERFFFSTAARDPETALLVETFGTRQATPARIFPRIAGRAISFRVREALSR
jgi:flavin-dependent dehydrogenase